jgi:hypothetical protein
MRKLVQLRPLTRPEQRGLQDKLKAEQLWAAEQGPFSVWSVPKLAKYCRRPRLLPPVTDEWVRRLLRREGLTPAQY